VDRAGEEEVLLHDEADAAPERRRVELPEVDPVDRDPARRRVVKRRRRFTSVDFPAPVAPTTATVSPGRISKEASGDLGAGRIGEGTFSNRVSLHALDLRRDKAARASAGCRDVEHARRKRRRSGGCCSARELADRRDDSARYSQSWMNSPPGECDPRSMRRRPGVEPWIALTTRSIAGKKSANRNAVLRFASR
jgi:hypothetical protein